VSTIAFTLGFAFVASACARIARTISPSSRVDARARVASRLAVALARRAHERTRATRARAPVRATDVPDICDA
jgi:hypothetical protein